MLSSSGNAFASGARASRQNIRRQTLSRARMTPRSFRSAKFAGSVFNNYSMPSIFYSTERIVEMKSKKPKSELPKSLYKADRETENCGVGLVASLKSTPSRKIVEQADEMLVRMSHRGGCGCDPASGDGAGEYLQPFKIYASV